ncbi:hypothetical protein BWQ96_09984 [Gracilariopsis chorda]|uniref:Uncharacterized protein n=1 Tax=Gracilariopsis chorda TaxID=448386 RepID=A0A2V3IE80_9FLOR|nr:hypothetical protein BWQ96_09984 [Gracilariopsis chorda]|eukprot:PXF40328.1 hypothetical protein BWQ96_09984 [Gracilariopsis chorda]
MLDVCDLFFEAWEDITETTLARCWIKADILPRGANNKLIRIHGKVKKEKSVIEEEDISCLARLFARIQVDSSDFVTPSGDSRINVADIRRWVTIEEEDDVREAMVNESFGQIEEALLGVAGTENEALNEADPVEEARQRTMLLPPLRDVAKLFEGVEDLAEKTGVLGASEGLRRAKRAFFEACREQGRKKSRQTLISEHFSK